MYKQNNYRGSGNRRNKTNAGGDRKINNEPLPDESNAIIINFRQYAKELDDKHDRYERIVKHSRDITIESKRIIFLLHTIDTKYWEDHLFLFYTFLFLFCSVYFV